MILWSISINVITSSVEMKIKYTRPSRVRPNLRKTLRAAIPVIISTSI
jgi:hypothetical protein